MKVLATAVICSVYFFGVIPLGVSMLNASSLLANVGAVFALVSGAIVGYRTITLMYKEKKE